MFSAGGGGCGGGSGLGEGGGGLGGLRGGSGSDGDGLGANGDGGDAFARLDYEDSDGDIPIIILIDSGYWDFREFGGIPANTSSNSNQNDVNFVVAAAADSGNTYTCIAEFLKNY